MLPEVRRSTTTITTSIPATSAASPRPEVAGASHTLGMGVGVATDDAGAGVGVAPAVILMLTVAVLPAAEPSRAYLRNLVTGAWQGSPEVKSRTRIVATVARQGFLTLRQDFPDSMLAALGSPLATGVPD